MILLVLFNCKKDNKERLDEPICRITSMVSGTAKYSFEFDTQGRVIVMRMDNSLASTNEIEHRFTYQENTIAVELFIEGNSKYKKIYTLENNRITGFTTTYNDGSRIVNEGKFEYNGNNQLSKKIRIVGSTAVNIVVDITYTNENITYLEEKLVEVASGRVLAKKENPKLDYNLNESRMPFIEFNYKRAYLSTFMGHVEEAVFYEQGLLGKPSKNQLSGSKDFDFNLTYDAKDSKNRIVGAKFYDSKPNKPTIIALEYTCK